MYFLYALLFPSQIKPVKDFYSLHPQFWWVKKSKPSFLLLCQQKPGLGLLPQVLRRLRKDPGNEFLRHIWTRPKSVLTLANKQDRKPLKNPLQNSLFLRRCFKQDLSWLFQGCISANYLAHWKPARELRAGCFSENQPYPGRNWLVFLKHSQHAVPLQIVNGQDSWPKGSPDSVLCPLLPQPLQSNLALLAVINKPVRPKT